MYLAVQLDLRYDGEAAISALRQALELYRQADDHAGMSDVLRRLGCAAGVYAGDLAEERRSLREACRHARIAGDDRLQGMALGALAAVSGGERRALLERATELLTASGSFRELAGHYSTAAYLALSEDCLEEATRLLETALEAVAKSNDPWATMIILGNIGLARLFAGEPGAAYEPFERQLRLCVEHGFGKGADEALVGLAAVTAAEGDKAEIAAQLRGAAHALGYPPTTFDRRIDDRLEHAYIAPARNRFGDAAWQAAERVGQALPYAEATAYALRQARRPSRSTRGDRLTMTPAAGPVVPHPGHQRASFASADATAASSTLSTQAGRWPARDLGQRRARSVSAVRCVEPRPERRFVVARDRRPG